MVMVVLFVFLFPMLAFTVLSFPVFLFLKANHSKNLVLFTSTGFILAGLFAFFFLALLGSLNDKPIASRDLLIIVLSLYGMLLGGFYWFLSSRVRRNENART